MEIKLLASDLDGTLVTNLAGTSNRVKLAVAQAVEKGIKVVLATGREYRITAGFAQTFGTNAPIICYQGGLIQDHQTGEILSAQYIPADISRRVIKFARARKLPMQLYSPQASYAELPSTLMYRTFFEQAKTPYVLVHNLLSALSDDELPIKFLFVQPESRSAGVYQLLKREFGAELTVIQSHETMIEVILPSVSKGEALKLVARRFDIPLSQVMAMGDQDNDVSMLEAAGFSVAMGNGSAQAKAAADVIAPPVTEDGAAWAIEKYILGTNHD